MEDRVRELLADVVEYDEASVLRAVEALAGMGPAGAALEAAVEALRDPQFAVSAAEVLRRMGPEAVPVLLAAGRGASGNFREWIRVVLRDRGDDYVRVLRAELLGGDAAIRIQVARQLALRGERAAEAVPDLISLLGDTAPAVRSAAAAALGAIGGPAEVPLREALHSSDPLVRSGAAEALGSLWDAGGKAGLARLAPLAAAAADPDPRVRVEAVRALRRLLSRVGEDCLHGCLQSSDSAVRVKAAQSMTRIDRRADSEILQTMLDDSDAAVRRSTAVAVLRLRDYSTEKCLGILIEGLNDPTDPERAAYAEALGGARHRARRAIPALAERALRDEDDRLRDAAITALGQIGPGDPDVIPVLIAAMDDVEYGLREAAMQAIAKFGPQADPAVSLIAARGGEIAAMTLGEIGTEAAVTELISLVGSYGNGHRKTWESACGSLWELRHLALPRLYKNWESRIGYSAPTPEETLWGLETVLESNEFKAFLAKSAEHHPDSDCRRLAAEWLARKSEYGT